MEGDIHGEEHDSIIAGKDVSNVIDKPPNSGIICCFLTSQHLIL